MRIFDANWPAIDNCAVFVQKLETIYTGLFEYRDGHQAEPAPIFLWKELDGSPVEPRLSRRTVHSDLQRFAIVDVLGGEFDGEFETLRTQSRRQERDQPPHLYRIAGVGLRPSLQFEMSTGFGCSTLLSIRFLPSPHARMGRASGPMLRDFDGHDAIAPE